MAAEDKYTAEQLRYRWLDFEGGTSRLWPNVVPWQRLALVEARELMREYDWKAGKANERRLALAEGKAVRLRASSHHVQVRVLATGLLQEVEERRQWVAKYPNGITE